MATRPRKKKQYSAPALEKGLDIMELLSEEPDGLSVRDMTLRLGRSVGELFRMVVVLEQRGYLATHPDSDLYTLTLKMFGLSHKFPPVRRLTTAAGPQLKRLANEIQQSVHLTVYSEGRGQVVVQQDSPAERLFSVRLGAEAPLINSCSGHVLLAFADDAERTDMVAKIPPHHETPRPEQLDKIVRRVRNRGYEKIKSAQVRGVQDIGCPVFDYTGRVVAALVVPFLAHMDDSHPVGLKDAREQAQATAAGISAILGFNK